MSVTEPEHDFVLLPHRSLGPKGFLLVMGLMSTVCFAAGIAFLIAGAWPVIGFLGLDVLLVWFAFRMSYRTGRVRTHHHPSRRPDGHAPRRPGP